MGGAKVLERREQRSTNKEAVMSVRIRFALGQEATRIGEQGSEDGSREIVIDLMFNMKRIESHVKGEGLEP